MRAQFRFFMKDAAGATAVEYCLVAALIAVVVVAAVTLVGTDVAATLTPISDAL